MKNIFVYMLILILTVGMLAGCRNRNEDETTTPTGASETNKPTSETQSTQSTQSTVPETSGNRDETGGMMDDMITEGSEFIDEVLPDTNGGNQSGNGGNGNSGGNANGSSGGNGNGNSGGNVNGSSGGSGNARRGRMPGRTRG